MIDFSQPVNNLHVMLTVVAILAMVAGGIVLVQREKKRRDRM